MTECENVPKLSGQAEIRTTEPPTKRTRPIGVAVSVTASNQSVLHRCTSCSGAVAYAERHTTSANTLPRRTAAGDQSVLLATDAIKLVYQPQVPQFTVVVPRAPFQHIHNFSVLKHLLFCIVWVHDIKEPVTPGLCPDVLATDVTSCGPTGVTREN